MLSSLASVLSQTKGAVGSFNVVDLGMAQAVAASAEEPGVPVIIGMAARHWEAIDGYALAPGLRAIADRAAVPVAVHLDHAGSQELDLIKKALELGFTSIMIDGSKLPFDDNCRVTLEVMELAESYGATGVSEEAIVEAVRRGVRKINHFPGLVVQAMDEIRAGAA